MDENIILDKRSLVRAVFIDYSKAFDMVNRNTLLSKLNKYMFTISPTACLSGLDRICQIVANVLGSVSYFPYGNTLRRFAPGVPTRSSGCFKTTDSSNRFLQRINTYF